MSKPLFTKAQHAQLIANGQRQAAGIDEDRYPVVKLFTPDGACTWLLTELDPEHHDIAFGLCDLGMGFPELGCVSLSEITSVRGPLGLSIERDLHFKAKYPISVYAEEARKHGSIQA